MAKRKLQSQVDSYQMVFGLISTKPKAHYGLFHRANDKYSTVSEMPSVTLHSMASHFILLRLLIASTCAVNAAISSLILLTCWLSTASSSSSSSSLSPSPISSSSSLSSSSDGRLPWTNFKGLGLDRPVSLARADAEGKNQGKPWGFSRAIKLLSVVGVANPGDKSEGEEGGEMTKGLTAVRGELPAGTDPLRVRAIVR